MAYFQIVRWVNVLITFCVVILGCVYSDLLSPVNSIFLAAISAALISAGGNVINDYYDFEVDKVNKSYRPLPSKKISLENALLLWFFTSVSGVTLSLFINFYAFFIAVIAVFLLFLYSYEAKNSLLIGNIIVSILTGMTFIYSGTAVGKYKDVLIPAVFAFLFHLGREILKDMQDIDADKKRDAVTLPIKYGKNIAVLCLGIVFTILILATILPFYFLKYSTLYLYIVIFGVDFVITAVYISILINKSERTVRLLSTVLKADILIGLTALLFK